MPLPHNHKTGQEEKISWKKVVCACGEGKGGWEGEEAMNDGGRGVRTNLT